MLSVNTTGLPIMPVISLSHNAIINFYFVLVYADGSICLDILQNRWSPTYDVSAILTSIQVRHNDRTHSLSAQRPNRMGLWHFAINKCHNSIRFSV